MSMSKRSHPPLSVGGLSTTDLQRRKQPTYQVSGMVFDIDMCPCPVITQAEMRIIIAG